MPLNRFTLHIYINKKQVSCFYIWVATILIWFSNNHSISIVLWSLLVWFVNLSISSFKFAVACCVSYMVFFSLFISLLLSIYALFDPIKKFVRKCMRWHEASGCNYGWVQFLLLRFRLVWVVYVCRPKQTKKQSIHQCTSEENKKKKKEKGNDPPKKSFHSYTHIHSYIEHHTHTVIFSLYQFFASIYPESEILLHNLVNVTGMLI